MNIYQLWAIGFELSAMSLVLDEAILFDVINKSTFTKSWLNQWSVSWSDQNDQKNKFCFWFAFASKTLNDPLSHWIFWILTLQQNEMHCSSFSFVFTLLSQWWSWWWWLFNWIELIPFQFHPLPFQKLHSIYYSFIWIELNFVNWTKFILSHHVFTYILTFDLLYLWS